MKRIILLFVALVVMVSYFTIPVLAAEETPVELSWIYNAYWYSETDEYFGVNNAVFECKPAYSEQTLTGTQSFRYEVTLTADVTDNNVTNNGWDSLEVYLAINGKPDTNLSGFEYPGYTDDSQNKILYDSFLVKINRYPTDKDATARVIQVVNSEVKELAKSVLTDDQRVNGHAFKFVFEYKYISDTENMLTVTLDGQRIFEKENCKDVVVGSVGFSSKYSYIKATDASLVYLANETPTPDISEPTAEITPSPEPTPVVTETPDVTEPTATEPPVESGDSNGIIMTGIFTIVICCAVMIILRSSKQKSI